jgi:phosphatidylinositol alpha 1,6-mannosyltransferase
VVRHLETGLLYDPADPRGLVRAVEALAADRHRGLLGERGREVVGVRTWADAVDELAGLHAALVPAAAGTPLP